jgi:hypothetical protein
MKSNQRTDVEIKAVARLWNSFDIGELPEHEEAVLSAVYHSLRWARGLREPEPAAFLAKRIGLRRLSGSQSPAGLATGAKGEEK